MNKGIAPAQARTGVVAGSRRRMIDVTLTAAQTLEGVFASPEAWKGVQAAPGDEITLFSHDGTAVWDRCMVTKAAGGCLWFSKPARIVTLDPETSLYGNSVECVVPDGTGFKIKNTRSGAVGDVRFASADAAKADILTRQPRDIGR